MRAVTMFVLWGSLMAVSAQEPSAKGVNFYSLDREVQLGREAAAGLERTLLLVHDARLDAYVAQLGANLAQQGDSQFTYTFTVYDDRKSVTAAPGSMTMPADAFQGPPTEPVAIAGGAVFVPLSLLASAPNEAEFAFQQVSSVKMRSTGTCHGAHCATPFHEIGDPDRDSASCDPRNSITTRLDRQFPHVII